MSTHEPTTDSSSDRPLDQPSTSELEAIRLKQVGRPIGYLLILALIGFSVALIGSRFFENAWQRFMMAYLVAFAFALSVSLGSLFFILVQHLTRAGWAVVVRRPAEVLSINLILVAALFLPIAWSVYRGDQLIYSWATGASANQNEHAESVKDDVAAGSIVPVSTVLDSPDRSESSSAGSNHAEHTPDKPYLSKQRFLVAWVIYFAIWIVIAGFYFSSSVHQDKTRDVKLTKRMEWCSGLAAVVFGFSLTFAAFDLLMSLDPIWYSTIFGVYFFAGCAVAGLAAVLLTVLILKKLRVAPNVFSDELQRDLGRLLFAFVFFWAYIAFSQYMLLWYANVPETTEWLVRRGMSTATGYTNSWGWLAIVLLLAHFMIPFAAIMSRHVKTNINAMILWTVWLLVIHYFDLYWIVIPQTNLELTLSPVEVGLFVGVVAVYLASALLIASRVGLLPVGDPRIHESLSRHEVY